MDSFQRLSSPKSVPQAAQYRDELRPLTAFEEQDLDGQPRQFPSLPPPQPRKVASVQAAKPDRVARHRVAPGRGMMVDEESTPQKNMNPGRAQAMRHDHLVAANDPIVGAPQFETEIGIYMVHEKLLIVTSHGAPGLDIDQAPGTHHSFNGRHTGLSDKEDVFTGMLRPD